MSDLWAFLRRWVGPLALVAALVLMGLYLWGAWKPEDNRLFQALGRLGYWWIAILFVGWFLYAFTNLFPRDWEKRTEGRGVVWERRSLMVSFSYVFAIFILLSPLWSRVLIDGQSKDQPGSEDQGESRYPIALVRGCAEPAKENPDVTPRRVDPKALPKEAPAPPRDDPKSIPKEVRCETNADQWLINIGGMIADGIKPSAPTSSSTREKRTETEQNPDKTEAGTKPAAPRGNIPVHIRGGLVVPLYFVIVSLMGGAVSLLRRVPEIQRRSEHDYVGTEKEPKLSPGEVRERLGFQIIQFISAPLIAVTAYHAIGPESRTASVALGFTSGFASESILLMIRGVVEGIKPQSVTQQIAKGVASGIVVDQKTKQPVANAALSVVGQPTLTAKSDANGLFAIHGIPVGEQVIEATLSGQNAKIKVTIDASKTAVCRIELP